jgi:hypothetical protein
MHGELLPVMQAPLAHLSHHLTPAAKPWELLAAVYPEAFPGAVAFPRKRLGAFLSLNLLPFNCLEGQRLLGTTCVLYYFSSMVGRISILHFYLRQYGRQST